MNTFEIKYAGYVGNKHLRIRVTPFFDAASAVRGKFEFIDVCANWQEHQRWNQQRVGNYAACPVLDDVAA
jgi:hypothetical protein